MPAVRHALTSHATTFVRHAADYTPVWFTIAVLYGLSVSPAMIPGPPLDYSVYVYGGNTLVSGSDTLYADVAGLDFTYPPFAAILFVPLTWINATVGGVLLTLLSLAALFDATRRWLTALAPSRAIWSAPLAAGAAFLEPIYNNFMLGQINLLLLWLLVVAWTSKRSSVQGALIGLAVSIKLTPAVFVAWLVVTKRWTAAAWSAASFAVCAALGYMALPESSRSFWSGTGFASERVGHVGYVPNQSVSGMLWRSAPEASWETWWLPIAAVVGALACAASWWMHRTIRPHRTHVNSVLPFALASVLCSPVAWTHHFVMVWPVMIAALVWASSPVAGAWRRVVFATTAVGLAVVFAYKVPWRASILDAPTGTHIGWDWATANAYVLAILVVFVAVPVCAPSLRRDTSGLPNALPAPTPAPVDAPANAPTLGGSTRRPAVPAQRTPHLPYGSVANPRRTMVKQTPTVVTKPHHNGQKPPKK